MKIKQASYGCKLQRCEAWAAPEIFLRFEPQDGPRWPKITLRSLLSCYLCHPCVLCYPRYFCSSCIPFSYLLTVANHVTPSFVFTVTLFILITLATLLISAILLPVSPLFHILPSSPLFTLYPVLVPSYYCYQCRHCM